MTTLILPLGLAFSAFGIAFWTPDQPRSVRAVYASVLGIVLILGVLTATTPAIAEAAWLGWSWAFLGLANVVGWVIVAAGIIFGEGASSSKDSEE